MKKITNVGGNLTNMITVLSKIRDLLSSSSCKRYFSNINTRKHNIMYFVGCAEQRSCDDVTPLKTHILYSIIQTGKVAT